MEIEEGTFSTVLGIRQKKAKGKRLEKWEEEFYRNNKDFDRKDLEECLIIYKAVSNATKSSDPLTGINLFLEDVIYDKEYSKITRKFAQRLKKENGTILNWLEG